MENNAELSHGDQAVENNEHGDQAVEDNDNKFRKILIAMILISLAIILFLVSVIVGYKVSLLQNSAEKENISDSLEQKTAEIMDQGNSSHMNNEIPAVENAEQPDAYEIVINRSYPIEAGFIAGTGRLDTVEGSIQMESNAAAAARSMIADLRRNGLKIIAVSGYRTDDYQQYLYNRQISRQGGNAYKAATISAVPLTSEHQAGLAIDLSTDGTLQSSFADTDSGRWLEEHCCEYGFIIRYSRDKEKSTGVIFEPWHFRYVGSAETAQRLTDSGMSMEEYYGKELAEEDISPYLPYLN